MRLQNRYLALIFAVVCTLMLMLANPALADVSPPGKPPGADIYPGDEATRVRMVAETVTLDILDDPAANTLGQAETHAIFTMRNMGNKDEQLEVRFPLSYWDYSSGDKRDNYPEIRDFKTFVNGESVQSRRAEFSDSEFQDGEMLPWAVFDVRFPAGEDVNIEVTYTTEAFGDNPFPAFRYIMQTGAGWFDTIGSADIIIRLPYEATPQNVLLSGQTGYGETTPGAIVSGNEVRWHFEDFEPSPWEHDITLIVVNQAYWVKVLQEQRNVAENPNDGNAWGRLGLACKNSIRFRRSMRRDSGGEELYDLSVQAYEKALAILPNDADWHAGFAELLWTRFYYVLQWEERSAAGPVLGQLLEEILASLTLDSDNKYAIRIADEIYYSSDYIDRTENGEYIFQALTDVPIFPTWTPTPTVTPTP
ncbi:MAG: hypothetical protein H8D34_04225 [Chloroflexi bacterium]|nr:hypothetical protein [Chloroflexota bacterium]